MQTSAEESHKQKGKKSVKTLRGENMRGDWYGYIRKKTAYTTDQGRSQIIKDLVNQNKNFGFLF